MKKDNLTKLIDNLLQENEELKEKVMKLENENNFLKMNNIDIKPTQPIDPWYNKNPRVEWVDPELIGGPTYPTDVFGNPIPCCLSSTTVVNCL